MTAAGREFQVAGTAQLKDRLPLSVRDLSCSFNQVLQTVRCHVLSAMEMLHETVPCQFVIDTDSDACSVYGTLVRDELERVCIVDVYVQAGWSY